MFLLVRLVHSIYCWTIFNILTSQKENVTELKFLWLVNTTGNSPKFILIFDLFRPGDLSINCLSETSNKLMLQLTPAHGYETGTIILFQVNNFDLTQQKIRLVPNFP